MTAKKMVAKINESISEQLVRYKDNANSKDELNRLKDSVELVDDFAELKSCLIDEKGFVSQETEWICDEYIKQINDLVNRD